VWGVAARSTSECESAGWSAAEDKDDMEFDLKLIYPERPVDVPLCSPLHAHGPDQKC
jgi:hypothetical protein